MKRTKWRIKALLEYLQFHAELISASITARTVDIKKKDNCPICFVAGCGRSGTTMLGKMLSLHPAINYLNEPRPLWIAISPRTDIWGYTDFGERPESLSISTKREKETRHLKKLFNSQFKIRQHKMLVEKTPENVFRLPWLHAIAPQAKLIHIIRDGTDVVQSIMVESSFDIPYGLQDMNNWYGKEDVKKRLLSETAKILGILPNAAEVCKQDLDWAALEWICSMRAFIKDQHQFSDSGYYQLRYEDLTDNPWEIFTEILLFLGLAVPQELKKDIINFVRPRRLHAPEVKLTSKIKMIFDAERTRLGYNSTS